MINFGSEINITTILSTKQTCSPIATVVIISVPQYAIILLQDKAAINTRPYQPSNMYSVSGPMFMNHQLLYYPHSPSLSLSLVLFFLVFNTHLL
jgi:hypothetical protein